MKIVIVQPNGPGLGLHGNLATGPKSVPGFGYITVSFRVNENLNDLCGNKLCKLCSSLDALYQEETPTK